LVVTVTAVQLDEHGRGDAHRRVAAVRALQGGADAPVPHGVLAGTGERGDGFAVEDQDGHRPSTGSTSSDGTAPSSSSSSVRYTSRRSRSSSCSTARDTNLLRPRSPTWDSTRAARSSSTLT